jgi:hypothetical protein
MTCGPLGDSEPGWCLHLTAARVIPGRRAAEWSLTPREPVEDEADAVGWSPET